MSCCSIANANPHAREHTDALVRAKDALHYPMYVLSQIWAVKNRPDKGAGPSRVKETLRSNREEVKVRL